MPRHCNTVAFDSCELDDRSYVYFYAIGYPLIIISIVLIIVRFAMLSQWNSPIYWAIFGVGIGLKILGWILVIIGRVRYRQSLHRHMCSRFQQPVVIAQQYGVPPPAGYPPAASYNPGNYAVQYNNYSSHTNGAPPPYNQQQKMQPN